MEKEVNTENIISSSTNKYLMIIKAKYKNSLSELEFVKDVKNNAGSISFQINGSKNLGCIDIGLYNITKYNQPKIISDYAIINNIKSDSSCNIANNLEFGEGTKNMIYTSLQTVLKICNWIFIKFFTLIYYVGI